MPARSVIFLSCRFFAEMAGRYLPNLPFSAVDFLDYGLHTVSKKLNAALQAYLDALTTPSLVVLSCGLCGNGLANLQAGCHALILSMVDDCIAILFGSRRQYQQEFEAWPAATYYLTTGWLAAKTDPLGEFERLSEKYDAITVKWIMDQQFRHYRRLVFLFLSDLDLETQRPRALQVGEYCCQWGMTYEEIPATDQYLRNLLEIPDRQSLSFERIIIVQPGEVLVSSRFTI